MPMGSTVQAVARSPMPLRWWPTPETEEPLTRRGWWSWLTPLPLLLSVADASSEGVTQWQPWSAITAVIAVAAFAFRHRRPFTALLVASGSWALVEIVAGLDGREIDMPFLHWCTIGLLLITVARHGVRSTLVVSAVVVPIGALLGTLAQPDTDVSVRLWSLAGWGFLAAATLAMRYRTSLAASRAESIRVAERERIARELHDVVAHHVSAIAIQAQGGRALAGADPSRAAEGYETIHGQASQALDEMRRMVTTLRGDDGLAPVPTLADLDRLADDTLQPPVVVRRSGDLDDLPAEITAAIMRIAQESITNARRHAQGATHIDVTVSRQIDTVSVSVVDHGHPVGRVRPSEGYGLIGMRERSEALGGTFAAGPADQLGWVVTATFPVGATR